MKNHLFHPYTRFSAIENDSFPNIVSGNGIYLKDDQGRSYVDIISSWWACALGHNHPIVVEAIKSQASILQHSITGSMTHPNVIALSDRLVNMMPTPDRHCLFASDGSSSIEAALKIALQYWHNIGKPEKNLLIGMDQAYHGDSLGALGVGFVDSFHTPYKNVVSPSFKLPFPKPTDKDVDGFDPAKKIIHEYGDQIAAIILEPLCLGSAGMKMYSAGYLKKISVVCEEKNILLIIDEIAMGFGRTGKMFAFEHAQIDPDIVCVGKALTAGYMPMSSCIVKDKIYNTFSDKTDKDCTFYHGNTYAGHPIGCAAALAAISVYEAEQTLDQSADKALLIKSQLKQFESISCVKNIRSLGMIGVVEIKQEFIKHIPELKKQLKEMGYLFRPLGTVLYLMPPLIISEEELQKAFETLKSVLEKIRH